MPKPPITSFSSVSVNSDYVVNNNYGLYTPSVTTDQRNAIPSNFQKLGGLIYNSTTDSLNVYLNNANNPVWATIATNVDGYVRGPANSVINNIAVFADTTGKVIADSGVLIDTVVPEIETLSINEFKLLNITTPSTKRIRNLGYVQFSGGVGSIYVDVLSPVHFVENNTSGSNYQISSVFSGTTPEASSSVSALVELKSTIGALLLSRLTTIQRDALISPTSGMVLYNSTINAFQGYVNGSWTLLSGGGTITAITAGTGLTGGTITTSGTIGLANTTVSAGSYTYGSFTVNAQGQLTSASNGTPPVTSITAGTGINITGTTTPTINLANTAVTPGSYTATNITVDAQGRITSASNGGGSFGDVTGPATSVNNNLVLFNGTTGKIIKDSGIGITNVYYAGNPTYLKDTSGSTNNFFAGTNSGNNIIAGAINNTGIGIMVLSANTTGADNTAIGRKALSNNISGGGNVAVGVESMSTSTIAGGNTAVGNYTLLNGGFANTAIGFNSLNGLLYFPPDFVPQYNVAIGYNSGYNYGLLQNCTFIGAYADALTNVQNACAIGYNSKVGVSNAIVLGAGCNIGIGKNSPTYALQIGTDNSTVPLLYMTSTNVPSTPGTVNDGIYSVSSGKPIFTSGTTKYQGTILTVKTDGSAATAGTANHSGIGPTTISTTAVNSNSLIFIQVYNNINYNITSVISNIIDNVSFDVNFNLNTAIIFKWILINP